MDVVRVRVRVRVRLGPRGEKRAGVRYVGGGGGDGDLDVSFGAGGVVTAGSNGGGFVGNGWVGEYHSPGTLPCGTGRSSMGQSGSPVARSKT